MASAPSCGAISKSDPLVIYTLEPTVLFHVLFPSIFGEAGKELNYFPQTHGFHPRRVWGFYFILFFFFGARLTFLENQFPAVGFVQAPELEGADTKPAFIPGVSIQTLIPDLSPAPTFPNPPGRVLDAPITIHGVTKIKKRGDKAK